MCPERVSALVSQGALAAKGCQVLGDGKEVPLYESCSGLNLARVREFNILFEPIGFGGGWREAAVAKEGRSKKINKDIVLYRYKTKAV